MEAIDYSGVYIRHVSNAKANGTRVRLEAIPGRPEGYYARFEVEPPGPRVPYPADVVAALVRDGVWTPAIHPALRVSEGL